MTQKTHKRNKLLAGFLFGALLTPALANENNESAILQAVDKVVAEHKVYATCFSLDPMIYRIVQDNWAREVKQGAEVLKELGASATLVARYAAAVQPARLLDESMNLPTAMTYCQKNEAQAKKFHDFGFSRLSEAIRNASKSRAK